MEELIKAMHEEMKDWILYDKESGCKYDLMKVEHVVPILEKYIKKAWEHDNN